MGMEQHDETGMVLLALPKRESEGIEVTFNAMPELRRLQFVDVKPNTKKLSA